MGCASWSRLSAGCLHTTRSLFHGNRVLPASRHSRAVSTPQTNRKRVRFMLSFPFCPPRHVLMKASLQLSGQPFSLGLVLVKPCRSQAVRHTFENRGSAAVVGLTPTSTPLLPWLARSPHPPKRGPRTRGPIAACFDLMPTVFAQRLPRRAFNARHCILF